MVGVAAAKRQQGQLLGPALAAHAGGVLQPAARRPAYTLQHRPAATTSHHITSLPPPAPLQDAEDFEAKRSRRGGGGGDKGAPAWASARADAKRGAAAAALAQELDEDDAFAVGGRCWDGAESRAGLGWG